MAREDSDFVFRTPVLTMRHPTFSRAAYCISLQCTINPAMSAGDSTLVWMDLCTLEKNYYFRFRISHVHKLGQKHDTFDITLNQKTNQSLRRLQYIVMISSSVTCITTIWDVCQISSWFSFQASFYSIENRMHQRKSRITLWLLLPDEVDSVGSRYSIIFSKLCSHILRIRCALCYAFIT
jgi:hypothetical protein